MAIWFECKVRYDKMQENGVVKRVNEPYIVDALSFTEAESRIIDEMHPFISGEFSISAVKKTKIAEIVFDPTGDKYYLVKYNIITLDERSGAEKRISVMTLVQAVDFDSALANFRESMKGTIADYDIASIAETQVMDVFQAQLEAKKADS